jgi:hypothetical protein
MHTASKICNGVHLPELLELIEEDPYLSHKNLAGVLAGFYFLKKNLIVVRDNHEILHRKKKPWSQYSNEKKHVFPFSNK